MTLIKYIYDSATVQDSITWTVFARPQDTVSLQDEITKIVTIRINDLVTINDDIGITLTKYISDSASVQDSIIWTIIRYVQDTATVQDDITKITFISQSDGALVNDILRITLIKYISDSASVQDTLTKTVFARPQDTVAVQDTILTNFITIRFGDVISVDESISVTFVKPINDVVSVQDSTSWTLTKYILDEATAQDSLSVTSIMRIQDETATVDDLIHIAPVTFRPIDTGLVQDTIRFTVTKYALDEATAQDSLSVTSIMRIQDETATVDDLIHIAPVTFRPIDTGLVQDTIRFTVTKYALDEATVQDSITWTITRYVQDTATVQDDINWHLTRIIQDTVLAQDAISSIPTLTMQDTATTQDAITPFGSLNIETRENGVLRPGVTTYRIIPDPFTGTGSLVVMDDGLANDYDNVAGNGQISVFPVPLDTYRINQTSVTAGYFSLINFTYATVHETDINSTALFAVFDKTLDPADVIQTNSDILDIANYTFDNIENKLFRVDAGVQTPIDEVDQMPEPIFIGANDPADPVVVAEAQPTLLYKNLGLNENETPEDVRNAFGLAPYDAGNFTETTFVGVFAATEQTSSGQYLSTIPHDSFNCGQRYVYSLDDTLVPTYGGLKLLNLTLDTNGICPESEDFITFEVTQTPPAGSGVPGLSGQDTLLYVNPQYPHDSVTADGVDFGNANNIDTFTFRLISTLPATGSIDDLTVYLLDGGWTTSGVNIISSQIIGAGPNAGMTELTVASTHLSKFLVGGNQIPPPSPPSIPPPSGHGNTGVGPGIGTGTGSGGKDIGTAKVHRIDYDVCTENISRILVSHDSANPPKLQLLTTKLGIVDASLAADQPYAVENESTLYDRYLFEAPLANGENIFTVFAIDRNSNVQRTLVEVEGCTGSLVFVDDQIVLPDIFDIKYQAQNSTVRVDAPEHSYVEEYQDMEISAIINSPIVPLAKADVYVKVLGDIPQTILPMDITPLPLPTMSTIYTVSAEIPGELLKGPAVEFWLRIVTEDGVVKETQHKIVGVKPDNYSAESAAEMDTVTIKAQGTTLRPTAYLTNTAEFPVYGTVSLIADGEKVASEPVLLTPGQNRITLDWKIPKSEDNRVYSIQTLLEVYDTQYITSEATLNTFIRTLIVPITAQSEILPITDKLGSTIARPAMLYASNAEGGQFRVTAPDGTCVIGTGCLVEDSTLHNRGAIDSVILDGQIFRVRYSGADNALERFSITSLDYVLGEWKVEIIQDVTSEFVALADSDVPIKVKYRAERSPLVTVTSE